MGEIDGEKGAWAYVKGGMGQVSEAIGSAAALRGVQIFVDQVGIKMQYSHLDTDTWYA